MARISDNQLYLVLIAAALAAGTTLVFFLLESRRSRRERREEYFLDSASDLADRVWETLVALRADSNARQTKHWSEVRQTALVLKVGLLGQTPRYRLAGIDAASNAVTDWLGSFIGFWAATLGRDSAGRGLIEALTSRDREQANAAPADTTDLATLVSNVPFTSDALDDALLEIYRESLSKLEDLVLGVLDVLSVYTPGKATMEVSPPSGSWPDYGAALAAATARRHDREAAIK